jgi:hypothetical protein
MNEKRVYVMVTFDDLTSAELFLTQSQWDGILEQLNREGVDLR